MAQPVLWAAGMSGAHDRFIRYVLGREEHAASFLRVALNAGLAARLRWATLKSLRSEVVDKLMRETRCDLIFSVRMRGSSQPAFIVLEHQSDVEERMPARMDDYIARVRAWWREEHPDSVQEPVIIGVVLYHGSTGPWRAPLRLEELLGIPLQEAQAEGWLEDVSRLRCALYDLMLLSEQELKALPCTALVRLALVLLRLWSTQERDSRLVYQADLFQAVYTSPNGRAHLWAVLSYLIDSGGEATGAVARRVLRSFMQEKHAEETMQTLGERLRAEGRREGEVKGEARGLAKGEARAVLRLLAARGVDVDARSRQRILRCRDLAKLDRWFDKALSANTLSDVLGDTTQ